MSTPAPSPAPGYNPSGAGSIDARAELQRRIGSYYLAVLFARASWFGSAPRNECVDALRPALTSGNDIEREMRMAEAIESGRQPDRGTPRRPQS